MRASTLLWRRWADDSIPASLATCHQENLLTRPTRTAYPPHNHCPAGSCWPTAGRTCYTTLASRLSSRHIHAWIARPLRLGRCSMLCRNAITPLAVVDSSGHETAMLKASMFRLSEVSWKERLPETFYFSTSHALNALPDMDALRLFDFLPRVQGYPACPYQGPR
jgi:hypothetical protein